MLSSLGTYVSDGTYVDKNGVQQLSGGDGIIGSNLGGSPTAGYSDGFIEFDLTNVNIDKNSKVILNLSDTGGIQLITYPTRLFPQII